MDLEFWQNLFPTRDPRYLWLEQLPLKLGPVVGYTTAKTSRIWVRAEKLEARLVLRYAESAGDATYDDSRGGFAPVCLVGPVRERPIELKAPYATGLVKLEGLQPDTRYFYEIVSADATREETALTLAQPPSFATLPQNDITHTEPGLRFAFLSCNGVHERPDAYKATNMWERLLLIALRDDPVRFAVLAGDQVYADHIRDSYMSLGHRSATLTPAQESAMYEQLVREYGRVYLAWWRRPTIRVFMAHVPCVATWDDHEIYDGWGSHGNEHEAPQQVFFRAAARAFDDHQMCLNPDRNGLAYEQGHRAFHFQVGRTGFLVMDLRTCRRADGVKPSALVGEPQWSYVDDALREFSDGVENLVVVTSVPPVYAIEWLHRIPGWLAGSLHDDLVDQWSSPVNRNDQLRLFGTLFEFRKRTGCNVAFMGGDIHVGALGRILSDNPRFLLPGERAAVLHQAVSSAIAYAPPTGVAAEFLKRGNEGKHKVSDDYTAYVDETFFTRNFATVAAITRPRKRELRFNLHIETQANPFAFYLTTQRS